MSVDLEFISTRRGRRSLLYEGRRYHWKKKYSNDSTFWLCYNNNQGCTGSITISNKNEIIKGKEHVEDVCKKDIAKNKILKELDKLKENASHSFESIQKQCDVTVNNLENEGIDILHVIPRFENIKTGLYNARNKVLGAPKVRFNSSEKVLIPQKYQNFKLAEYDDNSKQIILFCNENVREIIQEFEHVLGDGTFKSCPTAFKQLYTIHGYNEKTQSIIPLIYCLLPDKRHNTYEVVFRLIKAIFPDWQIKKITMDYELAAMKGIQKVYRKVDVKGCYYHLNRSIFRKAKHLKISTAVKKRHVARCVGLARLPKEYFNSGLKYVMHKSPHGKPISKFNKYFTNQWTKKTNFQKICCCSEEKIRTTNNLEGWHSRLNRFIGKKNPTLAHLLSILSKENKIADMYKKNTKTSKNYMEIDNEIQYTIAKLNKNHITVGHCIEIITPFSYKI